MSAGYKLNTFTTDEEVIVTELQGYMGDIAGQVFRQVLALQEHQVQQELIAAGWASPDMVAATQQEIADLKLKHATEIDAAHQAAPLFNVANEQIAALRDNALQRILSSANNRQASGGDLLDFKDTLRGCADIARAALRENDGSERLTPC